MRKRYLIVAVLLAGGSFAACSTPTSEPGQAARNIRLQTPPASEAPLVSSLEAGRTPERVQAHRPAQRTPTPARPLASRVTESPALPEPAGATVPRVIPTLSTTPLSLAGAPEQLPMAHQPMGPAAGQDQPRIIDEAYHPPTYAPPRAPGILIRGGMGGIDDKCDLHARRPGIAINRVTPPLFRGGIR